MTGGQGRVWSGATGTCVVGGDRDVWWSGATGTCVVGGDRDVCGVCGRGRACVVGSEGEFWRVEATPVVFRGCFG